MLYRNQLWADFDLLVRLLKCENIPAFRFRARACSIGPRISPAWASRMKWSLKASKLMVANTTSGPSAVRALQTESAPKLRLGDSG